VCYAIVTSLRIVTDGNKETTYLLIYLMVNPALTERQLLIVWKA